MRLMLALLAAFALLLSPVTAAVAHAACDGESQGAMARMNMSVAPAMSHAEGAEPSGAPCCDQAAHIAEVAYKGCAAACAATCSVALPLANLPVGVILLRRQADVPPPRLVASHPHKPPGLKRPPKSMA